MAGFFIPGKASVVVGGQFGSESKGLAAAFLAIHDHQKNLRIISTTNAGAQAGHTTILPDGRKFVCYHLPTIGVMIRDATIYLNAGSIIDIDLLIKEVNTVSMVTGEEVGHLWDRIVVHPHAAVIRPEHKDTESTGSVSRIGSTQKGVGEAIVSKIRREPEAVVSHEAHLFRLPCSVMDVNLNTVLRKGSHAVSVEIPQGTGLSINNAPFFPTCTSRDCWVGQGLTDAGIHPSFLGPVAMVCRTFPIRVGSIGERTPGKGYSGDFYDDSNELDWEDLPGIEPEKTTVTQRIRRIATWSSTQYRDALRLNRPDFVFLTFTNYLSAYSDNLHVFAHNMKEAERLEGLNPQHIYSWGPRADQANMDIHVAQKHSDAAFRPRPIEPRRSLPAAE